MQHSSREHATWSASATERNWSCPGALALTMDLPETTSEAADWGTCCHQVAEKCLRQSKDAVDFTGTVEKGKKFEFEVDDEMAETAQTYVDYVRETSVYGIHPLFVEQRFSLDAIKPPFEAGGTADAVIYNPDDQMLEVVDLKAGRGVVVDATENKQLRTYALGAMLANPGLNVRTVKATIVQPRAGHRDGRIRSETFSVGDLVEWTGDLLEAMKRSREAVVERTRVELGDLPEAAWNATHLKPGNHCTKTFCKAAGFCPAFQQHAYDKAGVWFDDLDQPRLANAPDAMSPEALAQALDAADMIDGWINAVRAYAHAQAEGGVVIPNYTLVERIGRRRWKGDEPEIVKALEARGIDRQHLWQEPKLKTPPMLEKTLGKKRAGDIADLIEKPVTGTNLVRADKTTRQAVPPVVERMFDKLD